ncbi:DoxX family protein [Chitinophaga alhagiae]|uniref:DoxX family protein n=1 Tax=Chitinophaga alhagiae TaxID=2203219 RepID=UPI000E5BB98C|nr:DoxX family protein [Chitinophaga alhagiae]
MSKRNKIIYWIATIWLALGMVSTGLVQLLRVKEETDFIINLGYPVYLLTLLGICKILGAVVVLIPRYPLLKEWAYAGFFFVMSGAIFSHFATGDMNKMFPALLLLALTVISWYFRPPGRKAVLAG